MSAQVHNVRIVHYRSRNSEDQIQLLIDSVCKQVVYYALDTACHLFSSIYYFFLVKKKLQKGVIVNSSAYYIAWKWGVICCVRRISLTCCIKKILDARSHTIFSPTLVIGVLNEMKVKCKLNASNKLASPCVSKLSSSIQEITLYFLQQQVLLHVYMTW